MLSHRAERAERRFDPRHDAWTFHELAEGERLAGVIVRLPDPGAFHGSKLFVRREDGVIAVYATAKRGRTILEFRLRELQVGDRITLVYHGKRRTLDDQREYRAYSLSVDGGRAR